MIYELPVYSVLIIFLNLYLIKNILGTPTNDLSENTNNDCSVKCVDQKYLKHYSAKGCKVAVTDPECKCPLAFDCTNLVERADSSVCEYNGETYKIGQTINLKNKCRVCGCRESLRFPENSTVKAYIDCGFHSGVECPEIVFGFKAQPNCYWAYTKERCCGSQECGDVSRKVCKYKDKVYKWGQKIYPEEDNCKICYCNEDWSDENALSSPACHIYDCEFELNDGFQRGCLPLYHKGTCCPIGYNCPTNYPEITFDAKNCVFDGNKYPIGSTIKLNNTCADCVCKVPPDFTCLHKYCD